MIKQINYHQYMTLLLKARSGNLRNYVNCTIPEDKRGTTYLKSEEGISYLRPDGFLGGMCRIKKGVERITDLHQVYRLMLGGHFLECYDGKLVEMYKNNGFHIVGRMGFDIDYAQKGWQFTKLVMKPDVVFMSLYDKPLKRSVSYDLLYDYAGSTTSYTIISSKKQGDRIRVEVHSLERALKLMKKEYGDILSCTENMGSYDYYLKGNVLIKATKITP